MTTGKGVTIHTIDCENLAQYQDEPERWLDVAWDSIGSSHQSHVARVNVTVLNEPGTLGDLSTVIAKNGGNISNLKVMDRQTDFFVLLIDIEVKDVKTLVGRHCSASCVDQGQYCRPRTRIASKTR